VLHLAALGVIRALGRGDQQAEYQRRNRSGQAGAESDDVLCIVGQMMIRQRPAQERSGERSGKDDHERDQGYCDGSHRFRPAFGQGFLEGCGPSRSERQFTNRPSSRKSRRCAQIAEHAEYMK
jgi:hypothetical protein